MLATAASVQPECEVAPITPEGDPEEDETDMAVDSAPLAVTPQSEEGICDEEIDELVDEPVDARPAVIRVAENAHINGGLDGRPKDATAEKSLSKGRIQSNGLRLP